MRLGNQSRVTALFPVDRRARVISARNGSPALRDDRKAGPVTHDRPDFIR